jgi:hypothetical protein
VLRCPREVAPFLPEILRVSVSFLQYDPNYAYEEDEEEEEEEDEGADGADGAGAMEEEGDEEEEEEEEDEDMGAGSDDDDTSWKVRKAAVKVLSAVSQAAPDRLPETWAAVAAPLIRRFKEREENVRLDVVQCFGVLLQALQQQQQQQSGSNASTAAAAAYSPAAATSTTSTTTASLLSPHLVRSLVSSCCVQLSVGFNSSSSSSSAAAAGASSSNSKTKCAVWNMLRVLMVTAPVRKKTLLTA